MISLSIIVPIYKVEQYIEKCIASILDDRLFDSHCELIVVNDGSPDRSMEIVERLCKGRSQVTLVNQPNQGLGAARNAGEARACGAYLWFVDSDDWILPGAIDMLLSLISTAAPDVINIDYVMSDGLRSTVENHAVAGVTYTGLDYLNLSWVQNPVQYYVFRSGFYRDKRLQFEKGIYHEDALFTPAALFQAQRVVRLSEACYVYNVREGSIMTAGNNLKHAQDMLRVVRKLEDFRKRHACTFIQSQVLSRYAAVAIGGIFYYWKLLNAKERRLVSAEIDTMRALGSICRSGSLKYLLALAIMACPNPFQRAAR